MHIQLPAINRFQLYSLILCGPFTFWKVKSNFKISILGGYTDVSDHGSTHTHNTVKYNQEFTQLLCLNMNPLIK